MGSSYESESLPTIERVTEQADLSSEHVPGARMAAAKVLIAQATSILSALETSGGEWDAHVASLTSLAGAAFGAIQKPVSFLGTCPNDGTQVEYDWAVGEYCCAMRHCPPS